MRCCVPRASTESCLNDSQRDSFWSGYKAHTARDVDSLQKRVSVWEPVTAVGSAAWWLERCLRRLKVMAGEGNDGSVPIPIEFYLQRVVEKLDNFEHTSSGEISPD